MTDDLEVFTPSDLLSLNHGIGVVRHTLPFLPSQYVGMVAVLPDGRKAPMLRDDASIGLVDAFHTWADVALTRYDQLGPEPDGWVPGLDGGHWLGVRAPSA